MNGWCNSHFFQEIFHVNTRIADANLVYKTASSKRVDLLTGIAAANIFY